MENSKQSITKKMEEMGAPLSLIEEMLSYSEVLKLKTQEKVIDVGQKCQQVFFVTTGAFVCQYFDTIYETERTINFHMESFQPFMFVPESYFRNTPSKCLLKAVRSSEVLVFRKSDMNKMLADSPLFNEFYYNQLVETLLHESDLRIRLLSLTPEQLYKEMITDYPEIIMTIPSKYIAEYLGISGEWLSKLKRKL